MNVKDLITELLEFDLEAEVDIRIESEKESSDFPIEFEETRFGDNHYLSLIVDLNNHYVLVDTSDFEEMQEKIDGLESEVEELRDMLAELE